MPRLTGPTATALEKNREKLNASFAAMRKAGTPIDPGAFMEHLQNTIAPIVDSVARDIPERANGLLDALFTVSLELYSRSLLGPGSRHSVVTDVWNQILPKIPTLLMRDPRRIAASLSNAGYNLGSSRSARPTFWISEMTRLSLHCTSVQEFLEAGKIAAWRAGMPQYRNGALAAAQSLAPAIAAESLELPRGTKADAITKILERMRADPWAAPSDPVGTAPARLVARTGAFRGFGGEFARPPKVWASKNCLYVSDGDSNWQLVSDRYGSMFARIDSPPREERTPPDIRVTPAGAITWGADKLQAPVSEISAWACDHHTLALTAASSHHVFLFARSHASMSGAADG